MRSAVGMFALVGLLGCAACASTTKVARTSPRVDVASTSASVASIEVVLKDGHVVGTPKVIENLTLFAISASHQQETGPLTTLDDALARKTAVVREVEESSEPQLRAHNAAQEDDADGAGPQVNTLVIENKGDVPIFVLAGTVVKGGNQDREIGEDFIIGAHKTVPVEAFCVEHGRWDQDRDGTKTQGQFGTMQTLANSNVRGAAQYQHNQEEVWQKVESVNETNHKAAASHTLMATLDDHAIAARRVEIAAKIQGAIAAAPDPNGVVGIAYAVDGKVRGVRFFANHRVFEMFRATLVNTLAVDAITAQAAGSARPTPLLPERVAEFVDAIEQSKVKEQRATKAANTNAYKESDAGYGSTTTVRPTANAPAAVRVSADYLAK